jgi:hypothetical protein
MAFLFLMQKNKHGSSARNREPNRLNNSDKILHNTHPFKIIKMVSHPHGSALPSPGFWPLRWGDEKPSLLIILLIYRLNVNQLQQDQN